MIRVGIGILLLVAACRSAPIYRAPVSADADVTYAAIVADGNRGIAPEDEALWRCELASAALNVGDEEVAFRALDRASRILGTLESTSAENARAIFGEEATKTWKGDPHERSMAALYKGLLYWRKGDLGNASACFKRGLLADAWSEIGESQTDFAVLSFLLGWVSHLRGRFEQARFSFKEAAGHNPENPFFADPRPEEFNVLAVIDIGRGPRKYATGPHNSVARYAQPPAHEAGLELTIDGDPWGASAPGTDLYTQAVTRGKKKIDGIRDGKAVFKSAAQIAGTWALIEGSSDRNDAMTAVGAGLLLLSALTNVEADIRYWSQLPAEVHVLPLYLSPGEHELELRALDWHGQIIRGWSRKFTVHVPPDRGDLLYYFRTGPRRTIHGLTDPTPEKKR